MLITLCGVIHDDAGIKLIRPSRAPKAWAVIVIWEATNNAHSVAWVWFQELKKACLTTPVYSHTVPDIFFLTFVVVELH